MFRYFPAAVPFTFGVLQAHTANLGTRSSDNAMAALILSVILFIICDIAGPLIPWILVTPPLCVMAFGLIYQPTMAFGSRLLNVL